MKISRLSTAALQRVAPMAVLVGDRAGRQRALGATSSTSKTKGAVASLVGLLLLSSCGTSDGTLVVVEAPAFTGMVQVDGGPPGPGPGDRYVVSIDGTDDNGRPVRSDWELSTVSVKGDVEIRLARGVFTFSDGSQLMLEGSAEYPTGEGTIAEATTIDRPLTGGSGAFAGATGFTRTIHRVDGTWRWEFHLDG